MQLSHFYRGFFCVCMCVFVRLCVYACCLCVCMCVYMYVHMCVYVCVCVHMYVFLYMYAWISYFQSTHDVPGTLEKMPASKTRECYILKALHRHGFTEVRGRSRHRWPPGGLGEPRGPGGPWRCPPNNARNLQHIGICIYCY